VEGSCAEYRIETVPEGRALLCCPDLRLLLCVMAIHLTHHPQSAEHLRIRGYDEQGALCEQIKAIPPRRHPRG